MTAEGAKVIPLIEAVFGNVPKAATHWYRVMWLGQRNGKRGPLGHGPAVTLSAPAVKERAAPAPVPVRSEEPAGPEPVSAVVQLWSVAQAQAERWGRQHEANAERVIQGERAFFEMQLAQQREFFSEIDRLRREADERSANATEGRLEQAIASLAARVEQGREPLEGDDFEDAGPLGDVERVVRAIGETWMPHLGPIFSCGQRRSSEAADRTAPTYCDLQDVMASESPRGIATKGQRLRRASFGFTRSILQVLHLPTRTVRHHPLGEHGAMALTGVRLEAQEGRRLAAGGRFDGVDDVRVFVDVRRVQRQTARDVGLLVAEGIAGRAQVHVLDTGPGEGLAQRRLREASLPRERQSSDVDDPLHARPTQRLEELGEGLARVPDGEDRPRSHTRDLGAVLNLRQPTSSRRSD